MGRRRAESGRELWQYDGPMTADDVMIAARRLECGQVGHDWEIVEQLGIGPVRLVCGRCDTGSLRVLHGDN